MYNFYLTLKIYFANVLAYSAISTHIGEHVVNSLKETDNYQIILYYIITMLHILLVKQLTNDIDISFNILIFCHCI